jgi:hypothetical protein
MDLPGLRFITPRVAGSTPAPATNPSLFFPNHFNDLQLSRDALIYLFGVLPGKANT